MFLTLQGQQPSTADLDPATPSRGAADRHEAVAALVDDLVNTCVLVSIFGSLVNARAAGRPIVGGGPSLRQLPPLPATPIADALPRDEAAAARSRGELLHLAYDRIVAARTESETQLARGNTDVDWAVLAEVWKRVATALGPALTAAFELDEFYGEPGTRYRKGTLMRFLSSVAAGTTPCLGVRGEIVVPGWIERRRDHRHTLLQPVILARRDKRDRGATLDISRSGLGLMGVVGAAVGEIIVVEFASGRTLQGYVAWTASDRLGLRLFSPLAESDPLLSGCTP